MEFYCVLSVGGSLASYQVRQEEDGKYRAVLRTNSGRQDNMPSEISLQKSGSEWRAEPRHDEIVQSLIHAIEKDVQ